MVSLENMLWVGSVEPTLISISIDVIIVLPHNLRYVNFDLFIQKFEVVAKWQLPGGTHCICEANGALWIGTLAHTLVIFDLKVSISITCFCTTCSPPIYRLWSEKHKTSPRIWVACISHTIWWLGQYRLHYSFGTQMYVDSLTQSSFSPNMMNIDTYTAPKTGIRGF